MAGVKISKLTKRFGKIEVLRGIDLDIRDGEFFTLAGPSGCGKSTLLNIIAGLESPTSGSIHLDQTDVTFSSPGDRDVAVVFQNYALYPHLNVFENMAFPLRIKKLEEPVIQSKVRETAALLGLNTFLERKPKELSGGQRQRVALGRAIVRHPKVFLLDEPLSNLDARLRVDMRTEIKRLHRKLKTTMVYVTHDQSEAMILSDRLAVMRDGKLEQWGTPHEIYNFPANRFVAEFLGSPSMNFLSATFPAENPRFVEAGEIHIPVPEKLQIELLARSLKSGSWMGIRPNDINVVQDPSIQPQGRILVLEPTGSETWVDIDFDCFRLRGKAPADFNGHPGDSVGIQVNPSKIHLFDRETGERFLSLSS